MARILIKKRFKRFRYFTYGGVGQAGGNEDYPPMFAATFAPLFIDLEKVHDVVGHNSSALACCKCKHCGIIEIFTNWIFIERYHVEVSFA